MLKKSMKKSIAVLMVFMMIFSLQISANAEEPVVEVFVDDVQIKFDVNPIIENGRTLVPMRYIFEALGAEVDWIDESQTAVATKGDTKIEITINSTEMLKNGEIITLDVPAKLLNERTLVPVRAVSEGLGAKVDWNESLFRVIITSPKIPETEPEAGSDSEPEPETSGAEYNHDELSEFDMELLKSLYADYRYQFEQQLICENIEAYNSENLNWSNIFNHQADELPLVIEEIWESGLIEIIMHIQINSDDNYIFKDITQESLINGYLKILDEADLRAADIFETRYSKTPKETTVLLIDYKNTDTNLACKYGAIVPDGKIARYFTAETDAVAAEFGMDTYFLCEVKTDSRGTYNTIQPSEKDFLAGIDVVLK